MILKKLSRIDNNNLAFYWYLMATPITHIILTEKIYKTYFSNCNKKDFFLWTLLPDIRYLDKTISRESTHTTNNTLATIQKLTTCFDKWFYFHSLVDNIRDNFYVSRWVYICGKNENFILALKLFEDQYLYPKIKNRHKYIHFLDTIPDKKIKNIKKKHLKKRYTMIKQEAITIPNDVSREKFNIELGLSKEYTDKINKIIHRLEKNKQICNLIDEFYKSFWSLIKNFTLKTITDGKTT